MEKPGTGRLESFSDGVFAVGITLLVLDLKVPMVNVIKQPSDLWILLAHQWPAFLAFFTSFITILILWLNHHMVMKHVQINDGNFMLINGLLLLFVTVIPFSTAILAEHVDGIAQKEAIILYNGTLFTVALMFQLFWRYAIKNERLLGPNCDRSEIKRINRQFTIGVTLYAIGFIASLIIPLLSLALTIFLAAYFTVVGIFMKDHHIS